MTDARLITHTINVLLINIRLTADFKIFKNLLVRLISLSLYALDDQFDIILTETMYWTDGKQIV